MPSALTAAPAPQRHHGLTIALHAAGALLLVGLIGSGLYMVSLSFSPLQLKLFNWHKWAGIAVLVLSVVRVVWRLSRAHPPLPPAIVQAMPVWQRAAHHAVQHSLYLLFLLVPLLGWAYSSAKGFPVVWLGLWRLPDWVPADPGLADTLQLAHRLAAWTLTGLIGLHVAAALKHWLIDRDGLLGRIWPWARLR